MNITTEQVFLVNPAELEQQHHTPASLQRTFTMPVATMHPEDPQTSGICLPQSGMDLPSGTHMCRLCATVTEMVVPIFEGEGLQNNLADKIHQHLPIQVSEGDVLPVVMCFQCTSTLLAWHELVACAVQADHAMRERFRLPPQGTKQQQQPTVQSSQTQIKDEKRTIRETSRASVECCHCSARLPDTELRDHMLRSHPTLLFLCAECRLYYQRDVLLPHMASHVECSPPGSCSHEHLPPAPDDTHYKLIPIVRIQRLPPKCPVPPPLVVTTATVTSAHVGPAAAPLHTPTVSAIHKIKHTSPPSLQNNYTTNNENIVTQSECVTERDGNANDDITTSQIQETESAVDEEIPKEPEKPDSAEQSNEFSDHSDTENDFGRLPESVFDAIEDSVDAQTNDTGGADRNNCANRNTKQTLPRRCPVCQKPCNSLSGWYYHVKRVHSDKNLPCTSCDKVFKTERELSTHTRTHTKEKPYNCRKCGAAFSSYAGRYLHEQTHGATRTRVCDRCPRAFRSNAQLARHLARHDANKNHVCPQCGRAFSVAFDLQRHVRCHNPGCFKCELCDTTFKQKRYLRVHMENVHCQSISTQSSKKLTKKCKEKVNL